MAEAKKPTAAAKKPVAKKEATVVKSAEDLKKDLANKQNDLMESQRSHRNGELVNPRVITATRKEIARLHTAIRAAELADAKESK
jgi:ribosomal protein L29